MGRPFDGSVMLRMVKGPSLVAEGFVSLIEEGKTGVAGSDFGIACLSFGAVGEVKRWISRACVEGEI